MNLIFLNFYTCSVEKDKVVHGEMMGEGFGMSVAGCDVNGDGLDDLVVGAPLHAADRHTYNTGRVHVFINTRNGFDDKKR